MKKKYIKDKITIGGKKYYIPFSRLQSKKANKFDIMNTSILRAANETDKKWYFAIEYSKFVNAALITVIKYYPLYELWRVK